MDLSVRSRAYCHSYHHKDGRLRRPALDMRLRVPSPLGSRSVNHRTSEVRLRACASIQTFIGVEPSVARRIPQLRCRPNLSVTRSQHRRKAPMPRSQLPCLHSSRPSLACPNTFRHQTLGLLWAYLVSRRSLPKNTARFPELRSITPRLLGAATELRSGSEKVSPGKLFCVSPQSSRPLSLANPIDRPACC